jgi:uncharacterized protein (TIGR02246 family)
MPILLVIALAASAIGVPRIPVAGTTQIASPATPESEVRAALVRYAELVQKMDHAGIAAMFAADGEIVNPGQDPIRGPEAIDAFLLKFSDYHVISETMTPEKTTLDGDRATQSGTYRQRVRTPDGQTVEVSGGFDLEWVRDTTGAWRIRRISTSPRR